MITTITYNSQSRIIRTGFSSVRHNYDYYYNPQFQFIIKSYSNRVPSSTHNYGSSGIWSDAMMSFMLLVSKENL